MGRARTSDTQLQHPSSIHASCYPCYPCYPCIIYPCIMHPSSIIPPLSLIKHLSHIFSPQMPGFCSAVQWPRPLAICCLRCAWLTWSGLCMADMEWALCRLGGVHLDLATCTLPSFTLAQLSHGLSARLSHGLSSSSGCSMCHVTCTYTIVWRLSFVPHIRV